MGSECCDVVLVTTAVKSDLAIFYPSKGEF